MVLLLADDEFYVRKKIVQKTDWDSLGIDKILEAEDGEEGKHLAQKEKIDILLTDIRMPRMDGISLAKEVRQLYPDCSVLFLSGYSDKEYLRSAITLHVFQYIDKPFTPEQIYQALLGVVSYKKSLLSSAAFSGRLKRAELACRLCSPLPCDCDVRGFLKEYSLNALDFCDSRTLILQIFQETIPQAVLDQLEQLLSDSSLPFLMSTYHDHYIVIHLLSERTQLISSLPSAFFQTLAARLRYLLGSIPFFFAVGILAENIQALYYSYQSAVIALQQNFFLGTGSVSFAGALSADSYIPDDTFRFELLESVKYQEPERCSAQLTSLLNNYRKHPGSLVSVVRESYYQILSQLLTYCLLHCPDFRPTGDRQLWDLISSAATLTELHQLTRQIYENYFTYRKEHSKSLSISGNIRKMVETNYSNPELGIPFLSEQLKLSPSYLSQIFKQETGTTINQFIISFRMDMACSLLLKSDRKVADIAQSCGFLDQNYFTKIFKKYTGLTPSDYRGYHIID